MSGDETRVVITGLGAVTSIGTGIEAFWQALLDGRSGISPIARFETSGADTHVGGEIPDFDPRAALPASRVDRYGRASQLAIAAGRLALADAGLPDRLAEPGVSVFVGTTMGECQVQEQVVEGRLQGKGDALAAAWRKVPDHVLAINLAREIAEAARTRVFPTACAAGNYAIGYGYDEIRAGRASVVIAGGCDAFSRMAFAGFSRMLSLSPDRCRPFDRDRKGILIGEGAGLLVLESWAHARARGATPYAEMLGYGLSCDAHHMTIPHPDGITAVMRRALASAGVEPDAVGLVSAHGTGTRMNDKTESEAIHRVFGERGGTVPVSSIKSMLGHTMGAASALEAIACVLAVRHNRIPPTINFETPDPECPIDCVPNVMREARVGVALNNSFAFGGNNAATVFGAWDHRAG
jgi:3-oxoacyl-[acyl-carrier-protein] synthase II